MSDYFNNYITNDKIRKKRKKDMFFFLMDSKHCEPKKWFSLAFQQITPQKNGPNRPIVFAQ